MTSRKNRAAVWVGNAKGSGRAPVSGTRVLGAIIWWRPTEPLDKRRNGRRREAILIFRGQVPLFAVLLGQCLDAVDLLHRDRARIRRWLAAELFESSPCPVRSGRCGSTEQILEDQADERKRRRRDQRDDIAAQPGGGATTDLRQCVRAFLVPMRLTHEFRC